MWAANLFQSMKPYERTFEPITESLGRQLAACNCFGQPGFAVKQHGDTDEQNACAKNSAYAWNRNRHKKNKRKKNGEKKQTVFSNNIDDLDKVYFLRGQSLDDQLDLLPKRSRFQYGFLSFCQVRMHVSCPLHT